MTSVAQDRLNGARSSLAVKAPVKAAASSNITLSGEQTIDGVALVSGDRVLLTAQTSGVDNGIYVVDTSTWERAPDCNGTRDLVRGTLVYVTGGTANFGFWYLTTTGEITVGTTSLTFAITSSVLAAVSAFMQTMLPAADATAALAILGITLPLPVASGGTGANNATTARANLGISNWPGLTNRVMNGTFEIDQIRESLTAYSVSAATVKTLDGWSGIATGAGVFSVQKVTNPDFASLFSMKISCTTIDAAIGASDIYAVFQNIEGNDVSDLAAGTASAATITISFDMKFDVAGTYGISIHNSAANRSYVGTVTQNVAGALEEKTVTLALDVTGTWVYGTGIGLQVAICLAAGSNFQTTAGAWAAGNFYTTSAQANFMSANTNVGYLSRFQLERGAVATEFECLSYAQNLQRCQRMYEKSFDQGVVPAQNVGISTGGPLVTMGVGTAIRATVQFSVEKRTTPTITTYAPDGASANWSTNGTTPTATVANVGTRSARIGADANVTDNAAFAIHWTADARLS